MPVSVEIKVNTKLVTTIHIGRSVYISGGPAQDSVNPYVAVAKSCEDYGYFEMGRLPTSHEWDNGTPFEHRYGDGLEICVEKALVALRQAGQIKGFVR